MWLPRNAALLGLLTLASKLETRVSAEFVLKTAPEILSPQDMLTLPTPGAPLANPAGDLALIPVSRYSFDDHKTHKSLAITPITAGSTPYELPLPDGGQFFWLDDRTMAHVVVTDDEEEQKMFTVPVTFTAGNVSVEQPVSIGSFPVITATNFRYAYDAGTLIFSAYVYPDGELNLVKENDESYANRGNTALVYDETFERHWDTWIGPKNKSLFTVQLVKQSNGTFTLGDNFTDVLKGTALSSPVGPFGGIRDFGVSSSQIIFTSKDPELPQAMHTKQNIYVVGFDGSGLTELTFGVHGAAYAPVFSHRGAKAAWIQQDEDGYESDRAKVVIFDLEKDVSFTITQDWDRSPRALAFSRNDDFIYFVTEDVARVKIFTLPVLPTPSESTAHPTLIPPYDTPVALTDTHFVYSGLQVLSNGSGLLFIMSSTGSPDDAYVLSNLQQIEASILSNASNLVKAELGQITHFSAASLQGKYLHPGEEFWFKGAEQDIQGWIVTPPGYQSADVKKWPAILLIHGGPEGFWADYWDSWNANVFAGQGYVVVEINPTGSTSFGQNLTEAVKEDWGGKPFVDLINGWKYVLENYPQIDPERAVAAGASYGGYAINWIQGNPEFGFGFKALVCHAGIFDTTYSGYATDELYFFNAEWGGRPWEEESLALSRKFSPAYTAQKWSTPELIIHGSKDYRIPESDGIAAWHTLQQLGVRSRLVIFPDESHWVNDPDNLLKWHYEIFRWFDEFVGENASVPLPN